MKYKFPVINHIDEVLPHVKDHPDFIIAVRDDFTVINYLLASNQTFTTPILRECRGLIFDNKTGKVLAHRFQKFFNVNEREETLVENIDFSQPHIILEKLDGSMITPLVWPERDGDYTYSNVRWATKMGETEIADQVVNFIDANEDMYYESYARWCANYNSTPIFEWCSRQNQVVIDHPEDRLVLLAVRQNITGEYWDRDELEYDSKHWNMDLVKEFSGTMESMQHLIDHTRDLVGEEGYVVRFDDGHMVKVKGEWYVTLHKIKEQMLFERNVVGMILENRMDDVMPFLLKEDAERLNVFAFALSLTMGKLVEATMNEIIEIRKNQYTRAEFGQHHLHKVPAPLQRIIWKTWDEEKIERKKTYDELVEVIKSHLTSNTKYDTMKKLIMPNMMNWSDR